jgi:hypothetical protein
MGMVEMAGCSVACPYHSCGEKIKIPKKKRRKKNFLKFINTVTFSSVKTISMSRI